MYNNYSSKHTTPYGIHRSINQSLYTLPRQPSAPPYPISLSNAFTSTFSALSITFPTGIRSWFMVSRSKTATVFKVS